MKVVLASRAEKDYRSILFVSEDRFGEKARQRYAALIEQSLRDIEENPERFGSMTRPALLAGGARTYHISVSRRNAPKPGVQEPRHFLLYRRKRDLKRGRDIIEVARILHDSADLASAPAAGLPPEELTCCD